MKKKRRKQHIRIYARIVSLFLVLTMLTNDFLGGGAVVWAAENQSSVEADAEQPAEGLTQETESDNNTQTEDADENLSEEGNGSESEREPIDEETGFEEEPAQEDESSGTASSGETEDDFLAEDEPQTVLILEEDVTKRASNVKYFKNADYSYTAAIYPYPIHYEEDGEWKEIDNQLGDGEKEEGTDFLENKSNLFKVKFSKKSNGSKLVKIKVDDFQISWDLKDALKVNAVEINENNRSAVPTLTEHKEEIEEIEQEEDLATIFTESPAAAQSGETDVAAAEEMYGNQMNGKSEYNNSIGILPEEQAVYQATGDEDEESPDADYYEAIQEANQEKMKVSNLSSGVRYEEIFPDVDIEYILSSQELKENIILKNANAQNEFVFQMKVNGLELVQEDEQIFFMDGEGNIVFELQKPYAYDAGGEFTDKVSMELVKGNGKKSELTVTVDREWIDAEERQFPIVIDPIVQTDQDSNSILDTYVLSAYRGANYYARPILKTGVDGDAGIARSFLRFTLPELKNGDMVTNASLNLCCYNTDTSAATVGVYQVMDTTWKSSEVTWNTQPVHEEVAEDYVVFTPTAGQWVTFSITNMVKYWYEQNANGGVMLRTLQEDNQYVKYFSSDYDEELMEARPTVLITYINNNGLESYWTYHEQDVGRAGNGYVNDYNGNLVFLHQTAATTGNRMPLALTHVYNTNDKDTDLGYGYGWRLNYLQTIKQTQISDIDCYEYVDEDGTYHYFKLDEKDNKWKDESGIDLELTIDSSSSDRFVITDKQDNQLIFNTSGKLYKIKDQNGNALTITYNGDKISAVTDGVGRQVTCTYDSAGFLSKITSPLGSKSFSYDSSNCLTKITDVDNETVCFTYNSLREMTSAQDIDGYTIWYTYSGFAPERISKVSESSDDGAGQNFQISRYANRSTFTDNKGQKEIYIFNDFGQTVSIQNEQGYAQSSKYITENDNTNKK